MLVYERHTADFDAQIKALEERRQEFTASVESLGLFTALDVPTRVGTHLVAPLGRLRAVRMIRPAHAVRSLAVAAACLLLLTLTLSARGAERAQPAAATTPPLSFNRDIRPILSNNCFACHGPDEKQRETKFHFDTAEAMFLEEGVIVPGSAAKSLLVKKITEPNPEDRMPPPDSGHALTARQIALLTRWIDEGARWDSHWSFTAPVRTEPPAAREAGWARNPIDQFIPARLEREGLRPSPEADKVTLLRRVTYDLTGLPPTPAEIDAFLADKSPDAYEKRVDALLASPHYGERMAMPWLDAARYADTHGYHIDSLRGMWHWRDWVINAFNRNLPFDQFVVEQLAGDLLPDATRRSEDRLGLQSQPHDQLRGWRDRRRIPGRIRDRSRRSDLVDVHGPDDGVRAVPLPQVRSDHAQGVLPVLRVLQLGAGTGPGWPHRQRRANPAAAVAGAEGAARRTERRHRRPRRGASPTRSSRRCSRRGKRASPTRSRRSTATRRWRTTSSTAASRTSPARYRHGRTVAGEPTFDVGQIGRGATFDGDVEVSFGNVGAFERTEPFSVALWLRGRGNLPMAGLQKFSGTDKVHGYEWLFDDIVLVDIQRWAARLNIRLVGETPADNLHIRTRERLTLGDWYHLALTYDGKGKAAGLRLYLNGRGLDVEVVRDALAGSMRSDAPLTVGSKSLGSPFRGQLDDFRIYDRDAGSRARSSSWRCTTARAPSCRASPASDRATKRSTSATTS